MLTVPMKDLAAVEISGADALTWLQGMITQDVLDLEAGESRYAAALTVKGKVLADLQLIVVDGAAVLEVPADRRDALIEHLSKRFVIEDVVLTPLEGAIVTLQGEGAVDKAAGLDCRARWIRSHTGLEGVDVLVDDARAVLGSTPDADLEPLRIRAAIPKFGVDFGEDTIPLEAGLLDAIHWSKGCYLGQEVIARMSHRGHTNRELRRLTVPPDASLNAGVALLPPDGTDKPVGRITSVAGGHALAMVRRKWFEAGTTLLADGHEVVVDEVRMRAHVPLRPENDPTITRGNKQTGMLRG